MSLLDQRLQAFVAVARHNNVHRASQDLYITQTAVTSRIKLLEQKLKTTLFARTRRGMLLTPEGETLLRYCQTVNDLSGKTLAMIRGAGESTSISLTITGATSIMRSRVIPGCLPVMQQYPELLLNFDIQDDLVVENRMRRGETQLGIMPVDRLSKEMDQKPLEPERYVMVGPCSWQGRRTKDIVKNERIIDFNPDDHTTFDYLRHFGLHDHARRERHFVNRTEALAMLVSQGLGYTVLTTEFAKRYVDLGEMVMLNHDKTYHHDVALAWYPRPEMPAYFEALINHIV